MGRWIGGVSVPESSNISPSRYCMMGMGEDGGGMEAGIEGLVPETPETHAHGSQSMYVLCCMHLVKDRHQNSPQSINGWHPGNSQGSS
jgi:hypothetical protein